MSSPSAQPRPDDATLLFAAESAAGLAELLARPDTALVNRTGGVEGTGPCRLGIVGPTAKNLALARRVVAKGRPWRGRNDVWFTTAPLLAQAGSGVAFLFPGLEGEFAPNVQDVASSLGEPAPSVDAGSIGSHAAGALRVGRLLDRALRRMGVEPDFVAGHSVGEWSAMSAGGMFSSAELDTMIQRCDLDAMAVPDLDFGVVGCPAHRLAPVLAQHPLVVISHENSTNQSVVCGPVEGVSAVLASMRADGVVCQVLPFRSGFHTPMLRPHLSFFQDGLAALPLRTPQVPVWSATTAAPFPEDPAEVRDLCVRHLLEPVRFRGTVQNLYAAGARVFVQVGSGQLGSLVSDTLRVEEHLAIAANSVHRSGLAQLRRVATSLWVEGGDPAFELDAPPELHAGRPVTSAPPTSAAPMSAAPMSAAPMSAAPISAAPMSASPAALELEALVAELTELTRLATIVLTGRVPDLVEEPEVPLPMLVPVPPTTNGAAPQPQDPARPPPADQQVLHVSTESMPYLLDHCFVPQRPGWPDELDRRPVVPATTVIAHLLDAARARTGGAQPIGLDDLRLNRWLVASPAVDVPIDTGPAGPGRLHVTLGGYADADVVFDEARAQPPAPWTPEAGERSPTVPAHELYEQRWLFHGEQFQVLRRTIAVGPLSVRSELLVTDVPGALLDGVGHVLGHWLVEQQDELWLAFPVRLGRLRFHGELPPSGTLVQCALRITSISGDGVQAEAQVTHQGRVVVSISGWTDQFFACPPGDNPAYRFPETGTVAQRQDDGRWIMHDRWADLASRELWMNRYLTGAEIRTCRQQPPREQRAWLLSRIAVKDAVRSALWEAGSGPIFPAELTVHGPEGGWCTVIGTHGLALPDIAVALAAGRRHAVAQVHPGDVARSWDPTRGAPLTIPDPSPTAKELST